MSRRRLPCRTTRWRISWPSAVAAMSGRPTSVWAMPRTTVIGVRSSWLTMARNSSLRRSTSSSRATVELRSAFSASSSLERLTAASYSSRRSSMTGPVTAADSRAWPCRAADSASSTAAGTSPLST